MARRFRKVPGCLGLVAGLVLLAVFVNFVLVWHFRRSSEAIAREMSAKGYPATIEELIAKHNRKDDQPNGADDVLAGLAKFNDEGVNYDLVPVMGTSEGWPSPGEPVQPEVLAEMNKVVSLNREALTLIRSGVHVECRFPLALDETRMPYSIQQFGKIRNAARLLYVQSLTAGESGDVETAIDSVNTILLLSYRYNQQPSVLTYLVGMAMLSMGQGSATQLLERGYLKEPAQFDHLSKVLDDAQTGDLVYVHWADVLWTAEDIKRHTKVTRLEQVFGSEGVAIASAIGSYANRYTFVGEADKFTTFRYVHEMTSLLDESTVLAGVNLDQIPEPEGLLDPIVDSSEIMPSYFSSHVTTEGRTRAWLRAAATMARVMRFRNEHQRLPDQQEFSEVVKPSVDPFSGQPLILRVEEYRVLVYSMGVNGKDDGGWPPDNNVQRNDMGVEINFPKPESGEAAGTEH